MSRRASELQYRHQKAWLAELPQPDGVRWGLHRGLYGADGLRAIRSRRAPVEPHPIVAVILPLSWLDDFSRVPTPGSVDLNPVTHLVTALLSGERQGRVERRSTTHPIEDEGTNDEDTHGDPELGVGEDGGEAHSGKMEGWRAWCLPAQAA